MVDEVTSVGRYIYILYESEVSYQHHSGPLGMSFKCKLVCDVIKLKILDCSRLASPLIGRLRQWNVYHICRCVK